MFKEYSINQFNKELASSQATPGGGTVAAYLGMVSSALAQMVINLTNKGASEDIRYEVKSVLDSALQGAKGINKDFLKLMDKDSKAFDAVLKAFKLPKETEEDKKYRSLQIQKGYKGALEIPLITARKTITLYEFIFVACKYGNKNAISDAGVAALSAQAALEGAVLNVKINAKSIKDKEYVATIIAECDELVAEGRIRRDDILAMVYEEISK